MKETEFKTEEITINVEHTDTFGGEANYSWVTRKSFKIDQEASDLAIVRRAKAELGMSGVRCRSNNMGDTIELRPYGICQIIFITFGED